MDAVIGHDGVNRAAVVGVGRSEPDLAGGALRTARRDTVKIDKGQ
ncbi:hypothetical protein [Jatrophihabitans sp.]